MANPERTNIPLGGEYQVFLNFRGCDIRHGFADTLYCALDDARIHIFMDDAEIRAGEVIADKLLQAIDDSKLYIPIFSRKYASSHWCLIELAKMMENISKSKEHENKKVIMPIFYDVEPEVLKLVDPLYPLYRDDRVELEKKKVNQEKKFTTGNVDEWRKALGEVDASKGLKLKDHTGDGDLSKSVVNEVVKRLQTRQRRVTEDVFGMEDRIQAINNLLDINSGGVRLIGIWGTGGMGKTTLAKKIFNQLCPRFGKCCSFLDDVRETAKNKAEGLVKLQKQLLSDISNSRVAHDFVYSDAGIEAIEGTICNKKVLIVLDDVDDADQIRNLIGMNSLYPSTRILVTTRNKDVLNIREFKYKIECYEMKGLSNTHALQLFCWHAFGDDSPPSGYYILSEKIVSAAGGLPLALQAIGSSLFEVEDEQIWEDMQKKLSQILLDDILGKLRIAYDALNSAQQEILLDVACFFIGQDKTYPMYMWEYCLFSPKSAIEVLTKRCMMRVLEDDSFWMHDQFRDLGREIAKEERTRLWDKEDITFELRSMEINESIQAMDLTNWSWNDNHITVTAEQIKRFPHLRCLRLCDVTCQGNFTGCLSELKWISLLYSDTKDAFRRHKRYLRFDATDFHLENVVVVNICGDEWRENKVRSLIKGARKSKVLTLEKSLSIQRTPTFSEYSVLEKLTISRCSSLMEIDCSIGKLRGLTNLSVTECGALKKLPEQIGELKNLQHLSLKECRSLRKLPDSISKLKSLTKLDVSWTSITRLPDSIDGLESLSSLYVSCTKIVTLPETISKFSQLRTLDLYDCYKILKLPELPRSLTTLKFRSNSLQIVPDLSNLTNLVELILSDEINFNVQSDMIQPCDLPWIGRLSKLIKLELCLQNCSVPPTEWGALCLLEKLTLHKLDLQTLKPLPSNLRVLNLFGAQVTQVELDGLPQLEDLTVLMCQLVTRISIPPSSRKLRKIHVQNCSELVEVQFLGVLTSMKSLYISGCKSFERLVCLSEEPGCNELQAPELTDGSRRLCIVSSSLEMLQKLTLLRCPELQDIQFISTLESMKKFFVEKCISLKKLGGLSNLKNLKCLNIRECESLRVVEGIDELEHLQQLEVHSCRSMERIIDASSSKIPKECQIQVRKCGELLDTGPYGSRITWECYREKILNAPTQASDSDVQATFYDCETETGDHPLEKQDDSDDDDDDEDSGEDDDDEDDGSDDNDNDGHEDYENGDNEDDEVDDVLLFRGPSTVCSVDDNDENDDIDEEGEGEANVNRDCKDDDDDDDDSADDDDENVHEVMQSSREPPPLCSLGDNDENNDVNEEGEGDGNGDEDRMRMRKRGTMKKPKRSKMKMMTTTTRKTMAMKTTTRATTTARTTMCWSFCCCLAGLCGLIPWTRTMRMRKVKGEGECDGNCEDEVESDDEEAEGEVRDGTE